MPGARSGAARSGWVDVDPTHGTFPGDDHVMIAVGRDYSDVPPNRGVWKGRADETISVSVKVDPIDRVPTELDRMVHDRAPWLTTSWLQSQRQEQRIKLSNQLAYRQQQGQQQQSADAANVPANRARWSGRRTSPFAATRILRKATGP